MITNWNFTDADRAAAAEIEGFLPSRLFDAHAHLFDTAHLAVPADHPFRQGPGVMSLDVWREHLARQVGGPRMSGGLFFPIPSSKADCLEAVNDFLIAEIARSPDSRGLVLVHPGSDRAKVQRWLELPQVAGFKVYHTFSPKQPTFEAPIESFLPEWAWQMADERGLCIMLHLVRKRALADSGNQQYIRSRCLDYGNARLILAHAARGFHAPDTINGLAALRGLENIWFDSSAICEPAAFTAILDRFGPRRLMWGSDFPVSELRGKCVTVGDGFAWLQPDSVLWDRVGPGCSPVLVGLESLRAMKQAADDFGLNAGDLQDIFAENALRLLGVHPKPEEQTQSLYAHAKQRIPGGTQLLSKRPEMLAPDRWPPYFREARGCEVWDLDGRHYYDMSTNGIGSCLLGFRDPDVTRAVRRRINLGSMCTLNAPEEVQLADLLCEIHPWADQVRFTRTGGEAMAVAVRIARATTKRSTVAICGYHGWHDWYLAANLGDNETLRGHLLPGLEPAGVPEQLRGTARTFAANSCEQLEAIITDCGDRLAAIVMEPCRFTPPAPGFLESVRDQARRCGAMLIFDEITIGWRLCAAGAHMHFGVIPDIAVFAKAMGNGHPIGAVIGTGASMNGAHESFISSTYWTESVGPTAALATLEKMRRVDVPAHIARIGDEVVRLWRKHAESHRLPVVAADGYTCLAHFHFDHPQARELMTLYTQLMLDRGFLAGGTLYSTLAHTDEVVSKYGQAIDEVFGIIRGAIASETVLQQLRGPVAHSGFRRLTS